MKVSNFASRVKDHDKASLLFSVSSIATSLEDLGNTLNRLNEEHLDIERFAGEWYITKSVLTAVSKVKHLERNAPYYHVMKGAVESAKRHVKFIEDYLKLDADKIWSGTTLTFKQAAIMDLIVRLENWVDYSYMCTEVLVGMTVKKDYETVLTKQDRDILKGTSAYYIQTITTLLNHNFNLKSELNAVPDMLATEENEHIIEATDKIKASLMSSGLAPHHFNPKYWYDLRRSKADLKRLEVLNQNNEQLAMMINLAITKRNGEEDPALEQQIEIYRENININKAKQEEIVRRYA